MANRARLYFLSTLASALITSAIVFFAFKGYAAPAGVAQNVQIGSQVVFGLQSVYPQTLLQYQEPTTTTAQFSGATTVVIPANSTNNQINTAALFPAFTTPVCIGLQDITNPGVSVGVGTSSTDTRVQIAANGFVVYRTASGLPTFYVDNATNAPAAIRVFGLSN